MEPSAEQTLKQLGIDRWVLRRAPDAPEDSVREASPAEAPALRAEATGTESAVPAALKAALADTRERAPEPETPSQPAPEPSGAPADLPACKVLAVGGAGVLVLSFAAVRPTLTQRLARDLLGSVATVSPGSEQPPLERIFDWDPATLASAQVSGRRALVAFAQRQLDDAAARCVLLTRDLLEAVPELPEALEGAGARCLEVPAFALLANDAEAKRQLWSKLQALKT